MSIYRYIKFSAIRFCNLIVLQCIYITAILLQHTCEISKNVSEQKILTVEDLR